MSMSFRTVALCGLAVILPACHARGGGDVEPAADDRMALSEVGDTVVYLQRTHARSGVVQPSGDTIVSSSERGDIIDVIRVAPDTLAAVYEHIRLRVSLGDRMRPADMEPLTEKPFYLTEVDGRTAIVHEPDVPGLESSVRSMAEQVEQLFLAAPEEPLAVGFVWVDTLASVEEQTEAHLERRSIVRYEVLADTVLHDLASKVVRHESTVDVSLISTAGRADSTRTRLQGSEQGTTIYAPGRDLVLAQERSGRIDGEVVTVLEGTTQRMPHFFEFRTTVELLPPADGTAAEAAEASGSGR